MMSFNLYHSLEGQTRDEKVDLAALKTNIEQLDLEGKTLIFALVYYNHSLNEKEPPPISDKVILDLNKLDMNLLQILQKFTVMHLQRMKELRALRVAELKQLSTIK